MNASPRHLATRWPAEVIRAITAVIALAAGATAAFAQEPTTRADEIELARREKVATLWPERESPLVVRANNLLDRGLIEGIRNGRGANGWQLVLSGTRPAQGQAFGIGYRRSDLLHDVLSARAAVAGTLSGAILVDLNAQLNGPRRLEGAYLDFGGVYERSPRMEFYGLGPDSRKEDRTGYLLQTTIFNARAGYRITPSLDVGGEYLTGRAHTGPVTRDDVPSIETRFDSTTAPGLFDDATFSVWGAVLGWDTRDLPSGPKSGGFYGVNMRQYTDLSNGTYSHRRLEFEGQQFFPYFNETRVLALFVRSKFAFAGSDERVVPFYLQPKLGGNFELRGFDQYRFYDNNAFVAAIEHRWYAFNGLEMALFFDAGKTVSEKGNINLSNLNYGGGIGFRARVQDAIVLRFDIARSREGMQWIWSVSDVSHRLF